MKNNRKLNKLSNTGMVPVFYPRLAIIAGLVLSVVAPASHAETHYVPFTYRQRSGTRPFVPVKINNQKFLFVVHANASFTAMATHKTAEESGITDLIKVGNYGISEPGKLSNLGRAKAVAKNFEVGGHGSKNLAINVFEVPQDPPIDGMIGVKWLKDSGAMADYAHNRLAIPEGEEDVAKEHLRLKKQGYLAHPITWSEEDSRFYIHPVINGVKSKFIVSTVAGNVLDDAFAKDVVTLGPGVETFFTPTGVHGDEREIRGDYSIKIDGQPMVSSKATTRDLYIYEDRKRPANSADLVGGILGCDFMRANEAVIDFGSGVIFIKPKDAAVKNDRKNSNF